MKFFIIWATILFLGCTSPGRKETSKKTMRNPSAVLDMLPLKGHEVLTIKVNSIEPDNLDEWGKDPKFGFRVHLNRSDYEKNYGLYVVTGSNGMLPNLVNQKVVFSINDLKTLLKDEPDNSNSSFGTCIRIDVEILGPPKFLDTDYEIGDSIKFCYKKSTEELHVDHLEGIDHPINQTKKINLSRNAGKASLTLTFK